LKAARVDAGGLKFAMRTSNQGWPNAR
jgi:hypothetical protein